jgi:hypothetical protein
MQDETKKTENETEVTTLQSDFAYDLRSHDDAIIDYDAYEAMFLSRTYDSVSRKVGSNITDGASATIVIERAARVVGQLPTGQVKAAGKKDAGKAALMDIILQKYIYPNANAQMPFLMKVREWQLKASVYGWMPMYYDWDVSPSGYVGPECWLWNPRNFIPQTGRSSISEMDYVHAISEVGKEYLQGLLDDDGWDQENVKALIDLVESSAISPDTKRDTYGSRLRQSQQTPKAIRLATRYESGKDGHWITFAPDHGYLVLRDIPNPHKSGKIPFVIKYCIPTYDSFYGLGDFQRMKPIQFAKDGVTGFYFSGIKINLFPPTVVNTHGVVKHSLTNITQPGSIIEEKIPNSVRRLETSTAGLSTYQAAVTQMQGSLLNIAGTTDTTANSSSALDPGFGKTPEALKQLGARESTRDNQDRFYLEQALSDLIEGMLSLIPEVGTATMPVDLFSEDVDAIIAAGHGDIAELLKVNESEQSARIDIKPGNLKGVTYRFQFDPGSTAAADKEAQKGAIIELLGVFGKFQNELQTMRETSGKEVNWEGIFSQYGAITGLPGLENLFVQAPPPPTPNPLDPSQAVPQGAQAAPTGQAPEQGVQPTAMPQPVQTQIAGTTFYDPHTSQAAQQIMQMAGNK